MHPVVESARYSTQGSSRTSRNNWKVFSKAPWTFFPDTTYCQACDLAGLITLHERRENACRTLFAFNPETLGLPKRAAIEPQSLVHLIPSYLLLQANAHVVQ